MHDWRSHIVFEVTPAWQGAVAVKTPVITVTPGKLLSAVWCLKAVPYVGIQASWDKCSMFNTSREINPHIGVVLQWCIVHPRQNVLQR